MPIVKTDVYDVQAPFALDLRLVKANTGARDAIGMFQRYLGMKVYTLSDDKWWQLVGGLTNEYWVESDGDDAMPIQSVVVNTSAPSGGNDGDIWFRQQGQTVTIYQRVSGTWAPLGNIELGGTTAISNGSITPSSTTSSLNSIAGAEAKPGTIIYRDFGIEGVLIFTKLDTDFWTYRQEAKAST